MNAEELIKEKQIDEEDVLQKIDKLPDELIRIIYSYLPIRVITFLSKDLYIHNHHLISEYILKGNRENYIRDIIRRDHGFVFSHLLNENFIKWIFEIKNYKYKTTIYNNYLYFVKDFCLIHESTKCRNIIHDFFLKHELCKNQHKKNHVRNIRWKT